MEISKYRRHEFDYAQIKWDAMQKGQNFPKALSVDKGHSTLYQFTPDYFFKRKQQDGNHGLNSVGYGIHSQHHFAYDEIQGSFDDLAEVMCHKIASRLGNVQKTDYLGRKYESPVIDTAKYYLAVYKNKDGDEERGCLTENVAKNAHLIQGTMFLQSLPCATPTKTPENSLPNYLEALKNYSKNIKGVLDPNIERDLIVNSYFCWKCGNSDNHCNNITFLQTKGPDGSIVFKVSPIIDNGSAWESALPYTTANGENRYENYFKIETEKENITPEEAKDITFTKNPFFNHTAFKLNGGNLHNHSKEFDGIPMNYEYDLVANALAKPEVYASIYQIEKNFDVDGAFQELKQEYSLKEPPYYFETIKATTEFKSQTLAAVMSNYYCHVAYTNCIEQVDVQNPSELYASFQEEMQKLPLQPSAEDYAAEFLKIASEQNIQVDEQALATLNFLPNPEPAQQAAQNNDIEQ